MSKVPSTEATPVPTATFGVVAVYARVPQTVVTAIAELVSATTAVGS